MNLNTEEWKEFFVKDLFIIDMGNKFDKNKMTTQKPSVNFISRTGSNNGLDLKVDLVEDVLPYKEEYYFTVRRKYRCLLLPAKTILYRTECGCSYRKNPYFSICKVIYYMFNYE